MKGGNVSEGRVCRESGGCIRESMKGSGKERRGSHLVDHMAEG